MSTVTARMADGSMVSIPTGNNVLVLGERAGDSHGWSAIRYGIGIPGRVATWTDPAGREHFVNLALIVELTR